MGLAIQVKDVVFSNPDLPVDEPPYEGLTDGLLAHWRPRLKAACIQPVNAATPVASLLGAPSFGNWYMRADHATGSNTHQPPTQQYSMCGLFRRSPIADNAGTACALAIGATGVDMIGFNDSGFRVQAFGTPTGQSSPQRIWAESHFATLDPQTSPDNWEFIAFTYSDTKCTMYVPRLGWSNFRNSITGSYFGNGGGSGNVSDYPACFGYENDTLFDVHASVDVACASMFDHEMTADEVMAQYQAVRAFYAELGIIDGTPGT